MLLRARGTRGDGTAPGAARLHLADGVPLLPPEEQVFEAMLDGWRNPQLARNLALSTINGQERKVRTFAVHADAFPWTWSSPLADDWFGDLRTVRGCVRALDAARLRGGGAAVLRLRRGARSSVLLYYTAIIRQLCSAGTVDAAITPRAETRWA